MPAEIPPATSPAMVAAATPSARAAKPAELVVGLRSAATKRPRSELVSLGPRRLTPVGGRIRLPLSDPQGYAVSPDGRRVAVATQELGSAERNRITIVRRSRWTRSRTVKLPTRLGAVKKVLWLRGDRLLVFTRAGESALRVSVVDPVKGVRRGSARQLFGFGAPRAAGDHVALFSTLDASRFDDGTAAKVLLLDAGGAETGRAELGDLAGPLMDEFSGERARPSYTVDPASGHVLALAGSVPLIVDVDPATAAVTPHPFTALTAKPAQQAWIEGAFDGSNLALTVPDADTGGAQTVPVDRTTLVPGTPQTVPGFGDLIGAGDLVLFPSGSLSASRLQGLRGATLGGEVRWTAEPGHRSSTALAIGRYLYADVQGVGSTIIDARTGKTVGHPRGRPLQLFDPRSDSFEAEQPWVGFGGDAR